MRLNKYLADSGVSSRRESERIVTSGRVKINGKTITDINIPVNDNDTVSVDGNTVKPIKKQYYIMLHKPKGYITSAKDELGRKTVMQLIDIKARLFPIGRLDYDTEGLLLLTNDGELANILTHPKHRIGKTYLVRLSGQLSTDSIQQLEKGVIIDGETTQPAIVDIISGDVHNTRLNITIFEGKNHQIKKMFDAVGHQVEFLKRIAIGEIKLGGLTRGTYRDLNKKELEYLNSLK